VNAAHAAHPCFFSGRCAPERTTLLYVTLVTLSYVFWILVPRSYCAVCGVVVQISPQAIGATPSIPSGALYFDNAVLRSLATLQVGSGVSTQAFYHSLYASAMPVYGAGSDPHLRPSGFSPQNLLDAYWGFQLTMHGELKAPVSVQKVLWRKA